MNGGEISGNNAFRGGAVLVFGGTQSGEYTAEPAQFIMNGGVISGNSATGYQGALRAAGGGVYVQNNAVFTMNDGIISNNISDHQGGGVATQDENGTGGVFVMNGGTISGNEAVNGGGVYSYSRAVQLLAGRIENNKASGLGGGMYVSTNPYSIRLGNALITGNSATTMGGGIWSCPIGTIDFANGHFAIYENTAGKAGDDVAALNKVTGTVTTLGSQMIGGGVMGWYQDGSISALSMDGNDWGAVSDSSVRYAEGDLRVTAPAESSKAFSAKAIVTDAAKAMAEGAATLIITGNTAAQGGGIGSNGIVELPGDPVETDSISVNKVWAGDVNPNQPESVIVELVMAEGEIEQVLDTVRLSEGNQWTFTFAFVPQKDAVYSVREVVPEGYESSVQVNEGLVTITNTYEAPIENPPELPDFPDQEEIPDDETPTTSDPTEEIPEEDTPLVSDPDEEITEEDVPLVDAPQTGSAAGSVCGVMALGMAALITIMIKRKK